MTGNTKLREELEQREMKPAELAKILGMDRRKVRGILRGDEEVRLKDVAIVAMALGFKVDLVFGQSTALDDLISRRRSRRAKVQWV